MTSTLHIHIGQCGNQVGEAFWSLAAAEASSSPSFSGDDDHHDSSTHPPTQPHPLFHEYDGKAAAVFIDSETKVIDKLRTRNPLLASKIRPEACVTDASGRANNWAMGFTSSLRELEQGHGLFHSAVRAVRKELERVDKLQSVVVHHSLAGGTGSGVGSAMLQYLREACPGVNLTASSVGPFSSGDCVTQWYNTTFALHALTEHADAVLYRENDHLLRSHLTAAAGQAGAGAGPSDKLRAVREQAVAKASMTVLNQSLAADLACLLFPTVPPPPLSMLDNRRSSNSSSSRKSGGRAGGDGALSSLSSSSSSSSASFTPLQPWDAHALTQSCCPFPFAKFLDLHSSWSLPSSSSASSTSTSCKTAAGQGHRSLSSFLSNGQDEWSSLGKDVMAMFPTHDMEGGVIATLAAQVTVRGIETQALPTAASCSAGWGSVVAAAGGDGGAGGGRKAKTTKGTMARRRKPQWSMNGGEEEEEEEEAQDTTKERNAFLPFATAPPADASLATLLHHDLPHTLRLVPWRQQSQTQVIETTYSLSPPPSSTHTHTQIPTTLPPKKGFALASNRTQMASSLTHILSRAETMAAHGAYLHWYTRHGIEVDDFEVAFDSLRRVREEYREMGGVCDGGGGGMSLWEKAGVRAVRDYHLR